MKKDTLFLLGGSPLQQDLINIAKERYKVIVIDGNPKCALGPEADEFVHLDFSNTEKLEALARQKQPTLILTMASEPANLAAAIVSAKHNLTYNTPDVVLTTINKLHMKQRLVDSCIATARYVPITQDTEVIPDVYDFKFPLVVKPAQSSAGRGVKLIQNRTELLQSIAQAKAISTDGSALVEEFIAGDQYSVETISCCGQHTILGVTQEYFGPPPYFAETQHIYPAQLNEELALRLRKIIIDTLNAFRIQHGACHIEVRVAPKGEIFIIEIASRIGGWRSELIRKATGIEYCDLLLQAHEGQKPIIKRSKAKFCLVKMLSNKEDIHLHKSLSKDKKYNVTEIVWLKSSFSREYSSLTDSAGYYFLETSNIEDALDAL